MAWSLLPVSEDDFLTRSIFDELYTHLRHIWDVHSFATVADPPEFEQDHECLAVSASAHHEDWQAQYKDGYTGYEYTLLLLMYLQFMHGISHSGVGTYYAPSEKVYQRKYYRSGSTFTAQSWSWVLTQTGLSASWASAIPYNAGTSYTAGQYCTYRKRVSSWYGDHAYFWRVYKCKQDCTGQTPPEGEGGGMESAYWTQGFIWSPERLNDLKTLIDFIAVNSYVAVYGDVSLSTTPETRGAMFMDEPDHNDLRYNVGTWQEALTSATGLANSALSEEFHTFSFNGGNRPVVTGDVYNGAGGGPGWDYVPYYYWYWLSIPSPPEWSSGGAAVSHRNVGLTWDSSGWHTDLKSTSAEYFLFCKAEWCIDPDVPWAFWTYRNRGFMSTPVELEGSQIGILHDNTTGSPGTVAEDALIEFDWADWNTGDDKGEFIYIDTAWSLFVPPEKWTSEPDLWTDTPPTAYVVNNVVRNAGLYWRCIQAHTSSAGTEPSTPGGAPYWEQTEDYGWEAPSGALEISSYEWTCATMKHIFIKPVYKSW